MTWKVEFDDRAAKELRKLNPQAQGEILAYLRERIATTESPRRLGKSLSGVLKGLWRYRIRDYRLICSISEREMNVVVLRVGHRRNIMAAAIFVSAFVFHAAIEGHDGIPPVPLQGAIDKSSLLNTWNAILQVNYWPVFSIARDLLAALPLRTVPAVMEPVAQSISKLSMLGATSYHDLTGRMFQTLVSDRKFLATF